MRKAWYKKYKDLTDEPVTLIDGSVIFPAVIRSLNQDFEGSPSITLLVRKYKDGTTDRVRVTKHSTGTLDYQIAEKNRDGHAKEFIGDPDWHAPRVYSNTIPGTSPSSIENYDVNTGRVYEGGRPELRKAYKDAGLALISSYEQRNMSNRSRPEANERGTIVHDRFTGARPEAPVGATESIYVENRKLAPWE